MYGTYLFSDINECEDTPCMNGGDCSDVVGRFECDCVEGYEGTTCETGKMVKRHSLYALRYGSQQCHLTIYYTGGGVIT